MKLTKLQIHKYRGVAPGTELTFSPSRSLLVGKNGTGRTTLLELLSKALCADFSGLTHEEFSLEYDLTFPGMKIHVRARNEPRSGSTRPQGAPREHWELTPQRPPEAKSNLEPLIEATLQ